MLLLIVIFLFFFPLQEQKGLNKIVLGLYPYEAVHPDDLGFKKGEKMKILEEWVYESESRLKFFRKDIVGLWNNTTHNLVNSSVRNQMWLDGSHSSESAVLASLPRPASSLKSVPFSNLQIFCFWQRTWVGQLIAFREHLFWASYWGVKGTDHIDGCNVFVFYFLSTKDTREVCSWTFLHDFRGPSLSDKVSDAHVQTKVSWKP